MHCDHNIFLRAIKEKRKIRLVYFREEDDSSPQVKLTAPMDYHLGHRATDKSDYYYFWDFEEADKGAPLVLDPGRIISMKLEEETFAPSEFITWNVRELPWFVKRDWGELS